jgi:hypothetical protein
MHLLNKHITLLLLIILLISTPALAGDALSADNAWVREGPPSATVLAGYLNISNQSERPYTLIRVSSPQFETVEMHESFEESGMMRMRKHDRIEISAHGELMFTPNGYHLMLMDPFKPARAGAQVELVLEFADQPALTVLAPVKRIID